MEKKFIRFVLTKEDTDLIGWKNSLPTRSFNETINKILVSESIGQIARIPCEFSSPEVAEEVDASFYVGDENVQMQLKVSFANTSSTTARTRQRSSAWTCFMRYS